MMTALSSYESLIDIVPENRLATLTPVNVEGSIVSTKPSPPTLRCAIFGTLIKPQYADANCGVSGKASNPKTAGEPRLPRHEAGVELSILVCGAHPR